SWFSPEIYLKLAGRLGRGPSSAHKKQGTLEKTSGRSLFSRAPRCAPLRLGLVKHPLGQCQVYETKWALICRRLQELPRVAKELLLYLEQQELCCNTLMI